MNVIHDGGCYLSAARGDTWFLPTWNDNSIKRLVLRCSIVPWGACTARALRLSGSRRSYHRRRARSTPLPVRSQRQSEAIALIGFMGGFRSERLSKCASDRPRSCEFPICSSKASTMQPGHIYHPKPRAVTSIAYREVRLIIEEHSREAMPV